MHKKPNILITNDDGIDAPGIKNLFEALRPIANLVVAAPSSEKSGVSLSVSLLTPLRLQRVAWEGAESIWKINGTPVDCVKLSLNLLYKENPPDLIVSGINRGANAGRSVLYSGTVGGVIEGALRKIPGIAFSCSNTVQPNYPTCHEAIRSIVLYLLENPISKGSFLNVNFPEELPYQGCKLTKQGMSYQKEKIAERFHPTEGHPYYWIGCEWEHHPEHEESDIALLKKGFITAVPIHVDQLTDHAFLQEKRNSFEKLVF